MKPNKYHNIWCVAMRKTAKMKKPERVVFRLTPRNTVHVLRHKLEGLTQRRFLVLNMRQAKATLETVRDWNNRPKLAHSQKMLGAAWDRCKGKVPA